MTHPNLKRAVGSLAPDADGRLNAGVAAGVAVGALMISGLLAHAAPNVERDRSVRRWYRALDKPAATPPDKVFAVIWPAIEVSLAVAGWRLMRAPASPRRNLALGLLALNAAQIPVYPAVFFGGRSVLGGLAASTAVVAGAWAYVLAAWPVDRVAAVAGLPLAKWTTFAEYLSAELFRRNR